VELASLLSAVTGVREALAAAEARTSSGRGRRHGDPYTVRQLTRINIPADDPAVAQVRAWWVWWLSVGLKGLQMGLGG